MATKEDEVRAAFNESRGQSTARVAARRLQESIDGLTSEQVSKLTQTPGFGKLVGDIADSSDLRDSVGGFRAEVARQIRSKINGS